MNIGFGLRIRVGLLFSSILSPVTVVVIVFPPWLDWLVVMMLFPLWLDWLVLLLSFIFSSRPSEVDAMLFLRVLQITNSFSDSLSLSVSLNYGTVVVIFEDLGGSGSILFSKVSSLHFSSKFLYTVLTGLLSFSGFIL